MPKDKIKKDKPISAKKEFRNQVTSQLKNALKGLEEKLGKKEFESRVKKATKLLAAGVKVKQVKPVKIKAVKKEIVPAEIKTE